MAIKGVFLKKVSKKVWQRMLDIAMDQDLDKGGLYDARLAAINIWCSPSDKPNDFTEPILRGRLRYPRAYVATIYAYHTNKGDVVLTLSVEKDSRETFRWAKEKAINLIENAEREQFAEKIVICPFCNRKFHDLKLFNEFVNHLAKHVKIKSVILSSEGYLIETEHGVITPREYLKYEIIKR